MHLKFTIACVFLLITLSCGDQRVDTGPGSDLPEGMSDPWDVRSVGKCALLLTNYHSLDELQSVIDIEYAVTVTGFGPFSRETPEVRLTHRCEDGQTVVSMDDGINEGDFLNARDGNFFDRAAIVFKSPYAIWKRYDILRIEILGRRRYNMFGEGDKAFYDLAETMVKQIREEDVRRMTEKELSEKGYLNTFNHITAQALITTLFSRRMAQMVSDVHERHYMPELLTGEFTSEQINDIENGPVDNYLDMVNNVYGQELGELLRDKYMITKDTRWTPELLADYLNDIQSYLSWVFHIGFEAFEPTDEIVVRFANKINIVHSDARRLRRHYF